MTPLEASREAADASNHGGADFLAPIPATAPEAVRRAMRDAWAEGSYFAKDGEPVLLFHGTDVEEAFNIFARSDEASIGYHFGTQEAANDRLRIMFRMGELVEGTVIPVICRAKNPLRLRDHYTWDLDEIASELKDLGIIAEEEVGALLDSCQEEFAYAAIERAGYDCVIYRNESEHKGEAAHDSLLIWRPELIKSPFASIFDLDDPRLLPQNATSAADVEMWRLKNEMIDDAAAVFAPAGPSM